MCGDDLNKYGIRFFKNPIKTWLYFQCPINLFRLLLFGKGKNMISLCN